MTRFLLSMLALVVGAAGCRQSGPEAKIGFDLAQLNADGLQGPPDGLRALSYEFCIPARPEGEAEVRAIHPTVELLPGARGRIGCGPDEVLVIGSTHQRGHREVLLKLAAL